MIDTDSNDLEHLAMILPHGGHLTKSGDNVACHY